MAKLPTDAELAASYKNFIAAIRAKFPQATIVAIRPFGGAGEQAIRQAVKAADNAGDKKVFFIDTTGWLAPEDYYDGRHPSISGHGKVAQRLIRELQQYLKN